MASKYLLVIRGGGGSEDPSMMSLSLRIAMLPFQITQAKKTAPLLFDLQRNWIRSRSHADNMSQIPHNFAAVMAAAEFCFYDSGGGREPRNKSRWKIRTPCGNYATRGRQNASFNMMGRHAR
jgi:hypothetical protein